MNSKEWDAFFDLLGKVINNLPGGWGEKADELKKQADERGSLGDLNELFGWSSKFEE